MADQKKCKEAMEEVGRAVRRMASVPIPGQKGYDGDEAIRQGREVAAKIRKELEEKRHK